MDAPTSGYYAPAVRIGADEGLGHRDGAKRRTAPDAMGKCQRGP